MAYGSAASGASNPVGVDVISAVDYQLEKILDATPGSTNGWVIDASGRGLVYIGGIQAGVTLPVALAGPATPARTNVNAAVASTTLLAANANRKWGAIYNDSASNLYLGLGAIAVTVTSFTVLLGAGDYFEFPTLYTGEVRGLWVTAVGAARLTEIT